MFIVLFTFLMQKQRQTREPSFGLFAWANRPWTWGLPIRQKLKNFIPWVCMDRFLSCVFFFYLKLQREKVIFFFLQLHFFPSHLLCYWLFCCFEENLKHKYNWFTFWFTIGFFRFTSLVYNNTDMEVIRKQRLWRSQYFDTQWCYVCIEQVLLNREVKISLDALLSHEQTPCLGPTLQILHLHITPSLLGATM